VVDHGKGGEESPGIVEAGVVDHGKGWEESPGIAEAGVFDHDKSWVESPGIVEAGVVDHGKGGEDASSIVVEEAACVTLENSEGPVIILFGHVTDLAPAESMPVFLSLEVSVGAQITFPN
jgi:hypothetical protein